MIQDILAIKNALTVGDTVTPTTLDDVMTRLDELETKLDQLQGQVDVLVEGQDVITEKLDEIGMPVGEGFSTYES